MTRCEHCLREAAGRCPVHPYAELLDPSRPGDQAWLAVLLQRRRHRRWQLARAALGAVFLVVGIIWPPLLALLVPLGGYVLRQRPQPPLLPSADALLPPDTTERAPRPRRAERGSGQRPAPGRVTIAG